MILSSLEIVRRLEGSGEFGCNNNRGAEVDHQGRIVIRPYSRSCQQPASYDLRVADDITLPKMLCTLVSSLEWIELPGDLAATLRCRSSFGRRGIIVTGGFVDPGFRGQLTLCLVNLGSEDLMLEKGDRVVQLILHQVSGGQDLYKGKYQDSIGTVHAR